MNSRHVMFSILLSAAAASAVADDGAIRVLAQRSGLSERDVAMVFDDNRSHAEYFYDRRSHARALRKLDEAIGRETTRRLLNGEKVRLARVSHLTESDVAVTGNSR